MESSFFPPKVFWQVCRNISKRGLHASSFNLVKGLNNAFDFLYCLLQAKSAVGRKLSYYSLIFNQRRHCCILVFDILFMDRKNCYVSRSKFACACVMSCTVY